MTGNFGFGASCTSRASQSAICFPSSSFDLPARCPVSKSGRIWASAHRRHSSSSHGHGPLENTASVGLGWRNARPREIPQAPEFWNSSLFVAPAVKKSEPSPTAEESVSLSGENGSSPTAEESVSLSGENGSIIETQPPGNGRLFSNLNENTLKHAPGTSSHFSFN